MSIEHSITHTYPDLRTYGQFKDILSIRTSARHRSVDMRVAKRPEKKWSREPPTAGAENRPQLHLLRHYLLQHLRCK